MKKRDLILALLVVIIWGANFTVIKLGLAGISSMLLVALRFTFTVFPRYFL
ncbi:MAG TPA: EamA family transporter [bacterium]|nr:EamA family transporter [bacterium]